MSSHHFEGKNTDQNALCWNRKGTWTITAHYGKWWVKCSGLEDQKFGGSSPSTAKLILWVLQQGSLHCALGILYHGWHCTLTLYSSLCCDVCDQNVLFCSQNSCFVTKKVVIFEVLAKFLSYSVTQLCSKCFVVFPAFPANCNWLGDK